MSASVPICVVYVYECVWMYDCVNASPMTSAFSVYLRFGQRRLLPPVAGLAASIAQLAQRGGGGWRSWDGVRPPP